MPLFPSRLPASPTPLRYAKALFQVELLLMGKEVKLLTTLVTHNLPGTISRDPKPDLRVCGDRFQGGGKKLSADIPSLKRELISLEGSDPVSCRPPWLPAMDSVEGLKKRLLQSICKITPDESPRPVRSLAVRRFSKWVRELHLSDVLLWRSSSLPRVRLLPQCEDHEQ